MLSQKLQRPAVPEARWEQGLAAHTSPCPCTPSSLEWHCRLVHARRARKRSPAPRRTGGRPMRAPVGLRAASCARTARARAALLRRPPPSQGRAAGSHLCSSRYRARALFGACSAPAGGGGWPGPPQALRASALPWRPPAGRAVPGRPSPPAAGFCHRCPCGSPPRRPLRRRRRGTRTTGASAAAAAPPRPPGPVRGGGSLSREGGEVAVVVQQVTNIIGSKGGLLACIARRHLGDQGPVNRTWQGRLQMGTPAA